MIVLYTITDFGLWFVAAFVISFIALMIIPAGEDIPGCVFGVIAIIAVICIAIAGSMHDNVDYWAYRYDKVLAKRESVMAACPDMSKHLCVEKYHAYQRDSVDVYERYMTARKE